MHHHIRTALRLSALSAALLAAGCGGGGGDSAAVSNDFAVTGVAAKGLIQNGVVEVFKLNNGAQVAQAVATTTTDDKGAYSLKVPKDVLTFVVQVRPKTPSEIGSGQPTKMLDESSTDINTTIAMPSGMTMRNVVVLQQPQATTSHISPFTEMVVKAATDGSGNLTKIANASAAVQTALGFDPSTVKPVDPRNSSGADGQQQLQSVMLAAIAKLANDGSVALNCPAKDVQCVVNKVASSASTSSVSIIDPAVQSTIKTALATVVNDPNINKTDVVSASLSLSAALDPAKPNGDTIPVLPVSELTALQAAKNLIASVRNTANALHNDSSSGALDLQVDGLKKEFDAAISPMDDDVRNWMSLIPQGIGFFKDYQNNPAQSFTMLSSDPFGYSPIVRCRIYTDADGKVQADQTTSHAQAVSVGCHTDGFIVPNSYTPINTPTSNGFTIRVVDKGITMVPNTSANTYTYKARTRLTTRTYTYNLGGGATMTSLVADPQPIGNYDGAGGPGTGSGSYTKSGDILTGFSVSGQMPARADDFGTKLTDYEQWSMTAARTALVNNVFKYTFAGDFTSMLGGKAIGKLSVASGSYINVQEDVNGNVVDNGVKEASLIVSGENGTSKISGSLSLNSFLTDKGGNYSPTSVTFNGSLSTSSAEFFSGSLSATMKNFDQYNPSQPDSSSNFTPVTVVVNGKITVPNRPALTLTATATTKWIGGSPNGQLYYGTNADVTGKYNDGTTEVDVTVTRSATGKTIAISSPSGVSVTFTSAASAADLMKGGVKVATVNANTGMVNYIDGSFESLQ